MNAEHKEQVQIAYSFFGTTSVFLPLVRGKVIQNYEGVTLAETHSSAHQNALLWNDVGVLTGSESNGLVAVRFEGQKQHAMYTTQAPGLRHTLTLDDDGKPVVFFRLPVRKWPDFNFSCGQFFGRNHVFQIVSKATDLRLVIVSLPVATLPFHVAEVGLELWVALLPANLQFHFGPPTQDNGKKLNHAFVGAYFAEVYGVRFTDQWGFAQWSDGEWHPLALEHITASVQEFLHRLVTSPGWTRLARLLDGRSAHKVVEALKFTARAYVSGNEPPRPII